MRHQMAVPPPSAGGGADRYLKRYFTCSLMVKLVKEIESPSPPQDSQRLMEPWPALAAATGDMEQDRGQSLPATQRRLCCC